MSTSGALLLAGLLGAAAPVGAADRWWAVAATLGGNNYQIVTYGAAWNFPTLDEAGAAAEEACRKQIRRNRPVNRWDCRPRRSGKNSCFFILARVADYSKTIVRDTKMVVEKGFHGTFFYVVRDGLDTRTKAEAEAKRLLQSPSRGDRPGWFETRRMYIDLLECSLPE